MIDQAMLTYYAFIAALFAASVIVGMIAGPIFVRILEAFAGKTKSTLDDRIILSIKVPLESFFFLIVFYFLIHSFLALFATIFAFFVLNAAQKRMGPSEVALILTAEPIFAALFAFLILHEVIGATQWLGALLMVVGMAIAETDLKLSRIILKKNY